MSEFLHLDISTHFIEVALARGIREVPDLAKHHIAETRLFEEPRSIKGLHRSWAIWIHLKALFNFLIFFSEVLMYMN